MITIESHSTRSENRLTLVCFVVVVAVARPVSTNIFCKLLRSFVKYIRVPSICSSNRPLVCRSVTGALPLHTFRRPYASWAGVYGRSLSFERPFAHPYVRAVSAESHSHRFWWLTFTVFPAILPFFHFRSVYLSLSLFKRYARFISHVIYVNDVSLVVRQFSFLRLWNCRHYFVCWRHLDYVNKCKTRSEEDIEVGMERVFVVVVRWDTELYEDSCREWTNGSGSWSMDVKDEGGLLHS